MVKLISKVDPMESNRDTDQFKGQELDLIQKRPLNVQLTKTQKLRKKLKLKYFAKEA